MVAAIRNPRSAMKPVFGGGTVKVIGDLITRGSQVFGTLRGLSETFRLPFGQR